MKCRWLSRAVVILLVALGGYAEAATVVVQPSSQDAFVQQDKPNRISSGKLLNQRIRVQSSLLVPPRLKRGLVQFDLSAIPVGATINSATLAVYEAINADTPRMHGVYRVNNAWLQSTVKWNNQPSSVAAATSTAAVGVSRGTRLFDVTADVQAFADAPTLNHGWQIKDTAEVVNASNQAAEITYISRAEDHIPDIPNRPKLTVDFSAPPCNVDADCADSNACTTNEHCQDGFCSVTPLTCDDGNLCTDDICDPSVGCLHPLGECNDGFACTTDSCNPSTGACTHTPVNTVCNDACGSGTCVADPDRSDVDPTTGCFVTQTSPPGTTCSADGNPCTNDVCDGSGHCGVFNTAPCNDGDACTTGDHCSAGQCEAGIPVVCTALDQCHDAGVCNPNTGQCPDPPKDAGASCNDGNGCTQTDQCDGQGACVGSNAVVCSPLDECHDAGACNPANGTCSNPAKGSGAACNDGNACTQTDQCDGLGSCVGSSPVVCSPLDQCHDTGTCNPANGTCSNPAKGSGAACNDGNACTQTDQCDGLGSCVGSSPVVCSPLDQCHDAGTCNPANGTCSNPTKQSGSTCNDGNACTQTDSCNGAGTCVGANPIVCTALDQCHDAGVCDTGSGQCSNPTKPVDTTCNDGNACTQTDRCNAGGTCTGSNPVVCTALDQCHEVGICNPSTGQCSNPNADNGKTCNDGNTCTLNDACINGACTSGISAMCGDGTTQPACGEECDSGGVTGGDCNAQCQFICGPSPQPGCRQPFVQKKGAFVLGDNPKDKNDRVLWTWTKGNGTLKTEFGSPLTSTQYTLCVYDGSGAQQPLMRAIIPPGGQCGKKPCWKSLKTGFSYHNKARTPEGIASMLLKAGTNGKARIVVNGKGVDLMMPALPAIASPVTVQLLNSTGGCWQAVYSAPFKKQKAKLFRDIAD